MCNTLTGLSKRKNTDWLKQMLLVGTLLFRPLDVLRGTIVLCMYSIAFLVTAIRDSLRRCFKAKKAPVLDMSVVPTEEETLVESIERQTLQWLTMETSLTEENLAKCNPQSNSPLYQLPKEIRDMIFEYACTQSADLSHPYAKDAYYFRPGHTARLKTHTSLLFTCRRAWLEAHDLPMRQAEHAFWFQRGPYDKQPDSGWSTNIRNERDRYTRVLRSLTTANLHNLTYIHLFMQMFQAREFNQTLRMELFLPLYYLKLGLRPKIFHVTIRQSDWWEWESDQPLSLDERWVQCVLDAYQLGGTEWFKLELETTASKKDELDNIVARLQKLEGQPNQTDPTDHNCAQKSKFVAVSPPEAQEWSRCAKLDGKVWPVFQGAEEVQLYAVTMSWRKQQDGSTNTAMPRQTTAAPTPAFPLPFHLTPIRTPAMILRLRSRRALIGEVKWDQIASFSQYSAAMQSHSVEQAAKSEDVRRTQFQRLFGEMEANRLMREWQACGSLLRFGGPLE